MKRFEGFPASATYCALPDQLIIDVLGQIDDLAELKVTFYLYWLLQRKRGYPKFATLSELLQEEPLLTGLSSDRTRADQFLRQGLERAKARGTILSLGIERDGRTEEIFLLNIEAGRRAVARIENGEIALGRAVPIVAAPERPSIFVLYEENIGMITPMIAEELLEAERIYPREWIEDAFREAVNLNKRSWRYVARILERWATDGRQHGTSRRHPTTNDSDKYFRGKYGHIVRS